MCNLLVSHVEKGEILSSSLDHVQQIIPKPATDYYHINFNDLYTSFSTDKKHLEE
jgi:hypothetical protein